ncbi:MAG: hypothetical protein AAFR94_01815 [Pseudomonadota bacterium]
MTRPVLARFYGRNMALLRLVFEPTVDDKVVCVPSAETGDVLSRCEPP